MRQCMSQAEVGLGAALRSGLWRGLWELAEREAEQRTRGHGSGFYMLREETAKAVLCPTDKPR